MRSNKRVTQKVIWAVLDYLKGFSTREKRFFGNTAIYFFDPCPHDSSAIQVLVTLCESNLMQIFVDRKTFKAQEIWIHAGYYYDKDGNPTSLTRERLNGLLDALGDELIIPKQVRVIYDPEDGLCYVNSPKERMVLNQNYCELVGLKADPENITFMLAEKQAKERSFCVSA